MMQECSPEGVLKTEPPGAFQLSLLRVFRLSKNYRDVFVLKEINGYGVQEIAAILGISIDTASTRLKGARLEIFKTSSAGVSRPTRRERFGFTTSLKEQPSLALRTRETFLGFVAAAQRSAPTVIMVACNIFR
jgi:hypothetical protein